MTFENKLRSEFRIKDVHFCSISEYGYIELHELDVVGTLGVGGFGRVELVQYHKDKNLAFALKCLKKSYVVEQQQEEHAYNEKRVMLACADCPFISK